MNQLLSACRIFPVFFVAIGLNASIAQTGHQTPPKPNTNENQQSEYDKRLPNDSRSNRSEELEGAIQEAIQQEPGLANANIQVKVTEKEVRLSGIAPSEDSKRTALRIALAYASGRPVRGSGIKVNPTRNQPSPGRGVTRP